MLVPPYKHLFFDWDDTLWDCSVNARTTLAALFEQCGLRRFYSDFEQYYRWYKPHNDLLWRAYARGEISKDELMYERFAYPLRQAGCYDEQVRQRMESSFLPLLATQLQMKPGARDLIETLYHRGYKLYVISNGFREVQQRKISRSGLAPYFQKLYLSEELKVHKPDPRFFAYAVKSSNARKSESLVIGDNFETDIVGAKNFGLAQAYYGDMPEEDMPFRPTYIFRHLQEMLACYAY